MEHILLALNPQGLQLLPLPNYAVEQPCIIPMVSNIIFEGMVEEYETVALLGIWGHNVGFMIRARYHQIVMIAS